MSQAADAEEKLRFEVSRVAAHAQAHGGGVACAHTLTWSMLRVYSTYAQAELEFVQSLANPEYLHRACAALRARTLTL